MRTTIVLNEDLLNEVKNLSGAKSKRAAVERALEEFVRRRKARKLIELEGKMELWADISYQTGNSTVATDEFGTLRAWVGTEVVFESETKPMVK